MLQIGIIRYKLKTSFRKLCNILYHQNKQNRTVDEMNKNAFKSIMALHGDTRKSLAAALNISKQTVGGTINGHSEFKQSEIRIIIDRYHLTPAEVDEIFFDGAEQCEIL